MSQRWSSTVFLIACGGSHAKPAAPTSEGPVYAALFERGRTFVFAAERTTTPPADEGQPEKKMLPDLTCTVTASETLDPATHLQRSTVTCTMPGDEAPTMGFPPAATYYANDAGLWFDMNSVKDHAPPKLDPKHMLIARVPVARNEEIGDGDTFAKEFYTAKASAHGAWCFGYTAAAGDEAGFELCASPKAGIESAKLFQAGATSVDVTLTAKAAK